MRHRAPLWLAPLVLAAGCAEEQGTLYPIPPEEARQILVRTELPPLVFGSDAPSAAVEAEAPDRIVWVVHKDGAELMRYTAAIAAEGEGTRIRLALRGAAEGRFGNVERRLAQNESVRNLYLVAMNERIASALEHRPFDPSKVYPALAQATAANIGSINARMDRAAAEYRRRDAANIEKAYRDEAAGRPY